MPGSEPGPAAGRVLFAVLHLLDRQLVDRRGRYAGKVDDLELTPDEDGTLFVSAVISGPGALSRRLGARRLGAWLERALACLGDPPANDPHIPFTRISDVGDHVTVAAEHHELATFAAGRWVRDHVIHHIPGSRVKPTEESEERG